MYSIFDSTGVRGVPTEFIPYRTRLPLELVGRVHQSVRVCSLLNASTARAVILDRAASHVALNALPVRTTKTLDLMLVHSARDDLVNRWRRFPRDAVVWQILSRSQAQVQVRQPPASRAASSGSCRTRFALEWRRRRVRPKSSAWPRVCSPGCALCCRAPRRLQRVRRHRHHRMRWRDDSNMRRTTRVVWSPSYYSLAATLLDALCLAVAVQFAERTAARREWCLAGLLCVLYCFGFSSPSTFEWDAVLIPLGAPDEEMTPHSRCRVAGL